MSEQQYDSRKVSARTGVIAILAQYGDYAEARGVASGVFDGIRNHGIQAGALPENSVTVLEARDSVMMALDRRDPAVRGRLVDLFFLLQLPVDTELDPRSIIPATDSGSGITSPHRRSPPADTTAFDPVRATPTSLPDTSAPSGVGSRPGGDAGSRYPST